MASMSDLKNELYANLSDEVRQELACHEQELTVSPGTSLVQYGIPANHLIILNAGLAEISVPSGTNTLSLGITGPGKVFALQSILSGEAAPTSITCLEACKVTLIPKEAFLRVLHRNPQMYLDIAKILSTDLTAADDVIRTYRDSSKSKRRNNSMAPLELA